MHKNMCATSNLRKKISSKINLCKHIFLHILRERDTAYNFMKYLLFRRLILFMFNNLALVHI